ncbi:hypothetical protein JW905_09125 [bacterium]|nr:hypothetical protein [candidate division CSSED10-310 bacterium]
MNRDHIVGLLMLILLSAAVMLGLVTLVTKAPPLVPDSPHSERIAMVRVTGIVESPSSPRFPPWSGSSFGTILRGIRAAAADDEIKGLIVCLDSPGGDVTVIQELAHEIDAARSGGLVVAAVLGDLAVAGAYYLAVHGDMVFASPGTITGGIGVYSTIAPDDRNHPAMQDLADQFLSTVIEARGLSLAPNDAARMAGLLTGREALAMNLVDDLGGMRAATEFIAMRAGLPSLQAVRPDQLGLRRGVLAGVLEVSWRPLLRHWLSSNPSLFRAPAMYLAPEAVLEKGGAMLPGELDNPATVPDNSGQASAASDTETDSMDTVRTEDGVVRIPAEGGAQS